MQSSTVKMRQRSEAFKMWIRRQRSSINWIEEVFLLL